MLLITKIPVKLKLLDPCYVRFRLEFSQSYPQGPHGSCHVELAQRRQEEQESRFLHWVQHLARRAVGDPGRSSGPMAESGTYVSGRQLGFPEAPLVTSPNLNAHSHQWDELAIE